MVENFFHSIALFLFAYIDMYIALLFSCLCLSRLFYEGMDGGRSRGRKPRQQQELREEREAATEQNREPRAEVGDQVATAIQRMTNILACLVEQ